MAYKYEKVKFDTVQELAKAVIDGGEFYYEGVLITYVCGEFNFHLYPSILNRVFVRKEMTMEELVAIKPRLCHVWDGELSKQIKHIEVITAINAKEKDKYIGTFSTWRYAEALTDSEIKQFLSDRK